MFPQYFLCHLGPGKYMGHHICPGQQCLWVGSPWLEWTSLFTEWRTDKPSLHWWQGTSWVAPFSSILYLQWKACADLSEHGTLSPSSAESLSLVVTLQATDIIPFRGKEKWVPRAGAKGAHRWLPGCFGNGVFGEAKRPPRCSDWITVLASHFSKTLSWIWDILLVGIKIHREKQILQWGVAF